MPQTSEGITPNFKGLSNLGRFSPLRSWLAAIFSHPLAGVITPAVLGALAQATTLSSPTPEDPPPRIVAASRSDAGRLEMTLSSAPGRANVVQRSINLLDWTTVATLSNPTGLVSFSDGINPEGPIQFYRFYETNQTAIPTVPRSAREWQATGATQDGVYKIDPDGPGGEEPFEAACIMSLSGGGWTALTDRVADSPINTDSSRPREYLYVQAGTQFWYRTPVSNLVWDWGSGKDLYGTYYYSTGAGESSFVVTESSERQSYGVGGSSGPGGTAKCLVIYADCLDPIHAQVQLCQDQPGIFGSACQCAVTVFIREMAITDPNP